MAILSSAEVFNVIDAIIGSGLDVTGNRSALLQFIDPFFVATLPHGNPPVSQLLTDIGKMNQVERLANGDIPLQLYLQNASLLLSGLTQQTVIRSTLDLIAQRASGAPRIDTVSLPEVKEAIIHSDDMVSFAFMEAGVLAAPAVMKLRVPGFMNGQPRKLNSGEQMNFLGTGWLLTEALLITNHHVINARKENEPAASEADLQLQAKGTMVLPDFDADDVEAGRITVQSLEAWNAGLDYAVLRIPATGRRPLRRAAAPITLGADPVPVNIIQHPGGRSKRYGIRNNLVSASTTTELRYFTDTEGGSSGSPVFNDSWEVVALHRASTSISNVQFQGKTTAYVNLGTHLSVILQDLEQWYPAIAAEIKI